MQEACGEKYSARGMRREADRVGLGCTARNTSIRREEVCDAPRRRTARWFFFVKMQTPITAVDSAQKYMVTTKLIISGGVSEYLYLITPPPLTKPLTAHY